MRGRRDTHNCDGSHLRSLEVGKLADVQAALVAPTLRKDNDYSF